MRFLRKTSKKLDILSRMIIHLLFTGLGLRGIRLKCCCHTVVVGLWFAFRQLIISKAGLWIIIIHDTTIIRFTGEISDFLFCTSCGQHYHGNCLHPYVNVNPVVRAGWQCPDCKICQTCRYILHNIS